MDSPTIPSAFRHTLGVVSSADELYMGHLCMGLTELLCLWYPCPDLRRL